MVTFVKFRRRRKWREYRKNEVERKSKGNLPLGSALIGSTAMHRRFAASVQESANVLVDKTTVSLG